MKLGRVLLSIIFIFLAFGLPMLLENIPLSTALGTAAYANNIVYDGVQYRLGSQPEMFMRTHAGWKFRANLNPIPAAAEVRASILPG